MIVQKRIENTRTREPYILIPNFFSASECELLVDKLEPPENMEEHWVESIDFAEDGKEDAGMKGRNFLLDIKKTKRYTGSLLTK